MPYSSSLKQPILSYLEGLDMLDPTALGKLSILVTRLSQCQSFINTIKLWYTLPNCIPNIGKAIKLKKKLCK